MNDQGTPQNNGANINPAGQQQAQPANTQPAQANPAGAVPGGQQPTAAQPMAAQPVAQPQTQQPIPQQATPTGTLATGQGGAHHFVIPPHPNTTFDEARFLTLLEGSISLTLEEKQKVIDAIPRLSIEQINELIKIFEEEKQKFAELEAEYGDDVAKLKKQRESEFELAKTKEEEMSEAEAEAAEAEALKRKLMGGE